MGKYKGSINGQEVDMVVDFTVLSSMKGLDAWHQVPIKDISIDGIKLYALSTETFPMLENIMTTDGSPGLGAKKAVWAPRGDSENPARCFMASNNAEPGGYFNIGTSKVQVTHENFTFTANECGGYRGTMDMGDFIKTVYASTCYYDLVHKANPDCFSSHVIYTTKDPEMRDALIAAGGWVEPDAGDAFSEALKSISPEIADGRPARFANEDGHFVERCIVSDDSEAGWHYGYEQKYLLVHVIESNLVGLTEVEEGDLGAAAASDC